MAYRTVGMASALEDLRLRTRGPSSRATSFAPTGLDDELLRAADAAIAFRIPLAFVLPFPAPAAPIYLAATAILGAIATNRGSDVEVAVAATHLTAATTYDHLYLRNERLGAFVPRVRISADGAPRGRALPGGRGRLFIASALPRLEGLLSELDALVIHASAMAGADLGAVLAHSRISKSGRLPVLYLTSNPLDPNLETLRRCGGLVWAWDAPSAGTLAEQASRGTSSVAGARADGVVVASDLLAISAEGVVTIAAPEQANGFDAALDSLWKALGELLASQVNGTPVDQMAARWAWATYHVAAACPVTAVRYDEHVRVNPYCPASRLADAPRIAREYARAAQGQRRAAWFAVASAFADVVDASEAEPKLAALVSWASNHISADRTGAIVVPNVAMVAAVTSALWESPDIADNWMGHVAVGTPRDLPNLVVADSKQRPDLCLLAGVPRSSAALLAAPPAGELTILAAGPNEARRVARAAIAARGALNRLRWETTELTAELLEISANCAYLAEDPGAFQLQRALPAFPELDEGSPWEPLTLDVLAVLHEVVNDPDPEAAAPGLVDDTGVRLKVDAIVFHLERDSAAGPERSTSQSAVVMLAPNDLVARRRGEHIDRVAAKAIVPEDVVLLVDHAARRDLLTAVIAKLSESTPYAALSRLIGFWHDRAAAVKIDGATYRSILNRMDGATITSETTVGAWVRADVAGPQDKANIARFADAVGDSALRQEAERVAWALNTLHRVHRKVGAWLAAQVSNAVVTSAGATVDAALDINVSDLLDAVTSWRISAVEPGRQPTPVPLLGSLVAIGSPVDC